MERCFTARELVITRSQLQWNAAYVHPQLHLVQFSAELRGSMCVTMPYFAKIGQTAAETWQFNTLKDGRHPPSCIFNNSKFYQSIGLRGSKFISMSNFVNIGRTTGEIQQFLDLQDSNHLGC